MNEDAVSSHAIIAAGALGALMMRNNSGALLDANGRPVRFGLMNETKEINARFKSSDWVGITPVVIGPQHVGRTLGVFTALEMKGTGWKMVPSDERAKAQLRFIDLVKKKGGFAGFVSDPLHVLQIIGV